MSDTLKQKLRTVEDDLAQLRRERADKLKARDEAREKFAAAPGYDTHSDEYKSANEAVKAVGEVDERIAEVQSAQVGILKMLGQNDSPVFDLRTKGVEADERTVKALVNGEAFKSVSKFAHTKSRFGSVALGELPADFALKADIAGAAGVRQAPNAGPVNPIYRALSVLDLIPSGPTTGDSVPYVQFAPAASVAAAVAEGDVKPNANATFTDAQADIDTIAAFYKVRKQVLADAAAVGTILEGQLRFDVRAALEAAVLAEILSTSGIGAVPNAAEPVADLISHAMTSIVLSNLVPDAVVAHPRDVERIRLSKDDNGSYQFGGPAFSGQSTVWGVPLVASVAVAEGSPLVGAFQSGATVFLRQGMEVLISDSDQDDFIRNRVTILGELRAGTAVWRPAAFATADLTA
jgi:HK97 family phage major capsid protein